MSERLMGWTNNLAEPKRTNRFELLLDDDLRLTCHSVSLPSIKVESVEINRMHNKYFVAGSKVTYDEVKLEFYDFIDNKAASALKAWYAKIYDQGTSLMGYPADYKKDLTLLIYGPDHSVVESWLFVGSWPKDMTRPGLDWKEGGGTINITVNLVIDEAKLVLS
jgi:hypothetical protein